MKQSKSWLMHALFVLSIIGMLGPDLWKLLARDNDPRVKVLGWFVVYHADSQMVIRTPGNHVIQFHYGIVFAVCIAYVFIWVALLVERMRLQKQAEMKKRKQEG